MYARYMYAECIGRGPNYISIYFSAIGAVKYNYCQYKNNKNLIFSVQLFVGWP